MPFSDGCRLIDHAVEAEHEDRLFLRWVVLYQMQMTFENFKQAAGDRGTERQPEDRRTAEEILGTVREILG